MARLENPILKGFLRGGTEKQGPAAFEAIIRGLIQMFLVFGVLVFLIYFFMGAFAWIMSQGEEAKVKEARDRITNALIGLFLVFLLFVILKFVGAIFGLDWLGTLSLPLIPF